MNEWVKRFISRHIIITAFAVMVVSLLFGCAGKPVISTQVIDRLVAVPCKVEMPGECKDAYSVDKVSVNDYPLTINRALRAEIEERRACEVKLKAAIAGCNK